MEKDSVKVFLRLRPSAKKEAKNPNLKYIDNIKSTDRMIVLSDKAFTFHHIFYSSSTQEQVFQAMVLPSIYKLIEGFNSTILAYGQSGAGKTYTMGLNIGQTGIIQRSIDRIFELAGADSEVSVSFVEIYNEKVYDLLSAKHEPCYAKGAKFNGSTKTSIFNADEANEILIIGNQNRHVRPTVLNLTSSRSHAMFSIFLNGRDTMSVIHFCDLAGSEGLRSTNHTGIKQQESININQGLLAVSKVVQAISGGAKNIPYRDSVLTTVLQDSLNVRSYITILGCISPSFEDKNETMSTIHFTQNVKNMESQNVPEYNAYNREKKTMQARTPFKAYMQPLTRNDTVNASATIKTPGIFKNVGHGKMAPPSTIKKYTGTIRKQPSSFASRFSAQTSAKKSDNRKTHDSIRSNTKLGSNNTTYMHQTSESIDNNTFDILNFSSSTVVGGPSEIAGTSETTCAQEPTTLPANVTQPSFSPFMRQIEQTINSKFMSFVESLQNRLTAQDMTLLQDTMRNDAMNDINQSNIETVTVKDPEMVNSAFDMRESLPTTSTVLRRPVHPKKQFTLTRTNLETTCIEGQEGNRRRLNLTTDLEESLNDMLPTANISMAPAVSSNRRVSSVVTTSLVNSEEEPIATRRSTRTRKNVSKFNPDFSRKKKKTKHDNVASYLNSTKPVSQEHHKQNILAIMNKGNFSNIIMLPTIGNKTAFQIMTYRSVKKHFRTLEDLKKVPAMNGKHWDKFMEANFLK